MYSLTNIPSGLSGMSTGTDLSDPEQLYALSQSYGGAIAQSGNEIFDPKRGLLSTIGEKTKNALGEFIDLISTGQYAVAGAMSSRYTASQAIEKGLTPSDVIFGDRPKHYDTYAGAVGMGMVRLASDVIFDPLTYVTFGAGGAASNVAKAGLKETFARQALAGLDKKVLTDLETQLADDVARGVVAKDLAQEEFARRVGVLTEPTVAEKMNQFISKNGLDPKKEAWDISFSKEAMSKTTEFAEHIRVGRQESFLDNEAQRLIDKDNTLTKATAREMAERDLANGNLKIVSELSNQRGWGTYKLIREEQSGSLIRETVEAELDVERARKAMTGLLNNNPALWETMVDKGGIKVLGKTILESQRLDKVIRVLPGFNKLSEVTSPMRRSIYNGYKRYFSGDIALSKEGAKIEDFGTLRQATEVKSYWQSLMEVRKNENFRFMADLTRRLQLSEGEATALQAAIEFRKVPADPLMAAVWNLANGFEYDKTLVPDNLIQGLAFAKRFYAKDIKEAYAAGYKTVNQENYAFHFIDSSEPTLVNRNGGILSAKHAQSNFAEWSDFENVATGESVISTPEKLMLTPFYKHVEETVINEHFDKILAKQSLKVSDIEDQISTAYMDIQEKIMTQGEGKFTDFVRAAVPDNDAYSMDTAIKLFRENFPMVDVKSLVEKRKLALVQHTTEMGDVLRMADSEVKKKLEDLARKTAQITNDSTAFGKGLNEALTREEIAGALLKADPMDISKALTVTAEEGASVVTTDFKNMIKEAHRIQKAYSKSLMENAIDKDKFNEFINTIANHAMENGHGLKRLLDGVIGKEQKLSKTLDDLNMAKLQKLNDLEKNNLLPNDVSLWKSKTGEMFRRYRAPVIEANKNGARFETNGMINMIAASDKTIRSTTASYFLQDVAKTAGRPLSEAPDGWREVNIAGLKEAPRSLSTYLRNSNGESLVFHPDVAEAIETMMQGVVNDKDLKGLLEGFDKLTGMFKATATSLIPSFHVTNAIGNVWNSYLDIGRHALDPLKQTRAAQIQKAEKAIHQLSIDVQVGKEGSKEALTRAMSRVIQVDATGHQWTMGELIRTLKNYNIAFGNQFSGVIGLETATLKDYITNIDTKFFKEAEEGLIKKGTHGGKQLVKQAFEGGQNFGQIVENQARIVHFLAHLEKTGDVGLAANRTKMFLFDYSNLSSFEKTIVRRFVPFYTWTKKNLEIQAKTLVTKPGRLSQQVSLMRNLSDMISGDGQLSKEEHNKLPFWLKNSFTATKKKNGQVVYLWSGLNTPLQGALSLANPNTLVSSANPLLKLPVELVTGYDTFRGGMIDPHSNAALLQEAPTFFQDMMGYTSYTYKTKEGKSIQVHTALNTKAFHAFMNFPIGGRLFSEGLQWNKLEEDYINGKIPLSQLMLQVMTPAQLRELDLDKLSEQEQKAKAKKLQDMLTSAGIIYKMDKPVRSKNTEIVSN
jgi:hypothetical protein